MKSLLLLAALWLAAGSANADFDELTRSHRLLWDQGALLLEVRKAVDPAAPLSPATRFQAEQRIEEALAYLYMEAVQDVPVDSHDSVGDRLAASGALFRALSERAAAGVSRQSAAFARDLHAVVVVYRFPLFGEQGLAASFVQHERAFPVPRLLGFAPARSFTGLVILAQGRVPEPRKGPARADPPGAAAAPVRRGHEPRALRGDVRPAGPAQVGRGRLRLFGGGGRAGGLSRPHRRRCPCAPWPAGCSGATPPTSCCPRRWPGSFSRASTTATCCAKAGS